MFSEVLEADSATGSWTLNPDLVSHQTATGRPAGSESAKLTLLDEEWAENLQCLSKDLGWNAICNLDQLPEASTPQDALLAAC